MPACTRHTLHLSGETLSKKEIVQQTGLAILYERVQRLQKALKHGTVLAATALHQGSRQGSGGKGGQI